MTPRNTTVQRITQVVHPVGRGKKKQLLAHIIQEHNWSQVLVFTRTKFGANNVAEFLTKNGIKAMALHGNKSQSARTQALAGFKSGDIRALVATDIAARGIDIDELPHVVNYEIPNVPEDYVHRIGRTGRAGNDGAAVSLVCLDEEGFMQEIERFTKQQIPAQVIEGFGPEPGERAEPIAMGRQTIWGGAGQAAQPRSDGGRGQGRAPGNDAAHPRQQGRRRPAPAARAIGNGRAQRQPQRPAQRNGAAQPQGQRTQRRPGRTQRRAPAPRHSNGQPPRHNGHGAGRATTDEAQPRDGAHNIASPFVQRDATPRNTDGQPDPCAPASTAWAGAGAAAAAAAAARTVLVAGASGLVGREILQGLLADESVAAVHSLGRRELPLSIPS